MVKLKNWNGKNIIKHRLNQEEKTHVLSSSLNIFILQHVARSNKKYVKETKRKGIQTKKEITMRARQEHA